MKVDEWDEMDSKKLYAAAKAAQADFRVGVDPANGSDFLAVSIVSTEDTLEGLALAMLAGARAIETNWRCSGSIYVRDPFVECGGPREMSYFKAAQLLRTQGERILNMVERGTI